MKSKYRELTASCLERVHNYLDDSEEMTSFYSDAFRHRTRDSFKEIEDTLHVDVSEGSSNVKYLSEIEQSDPVEQLISKDFWEHRRRYARKGAAEALYDIASEYEDIIIHSNQLTYHAPSQGGLAALETAKKIEEEANVKADSTLDIIDHINGRLTEQEEDIWLKWLNQRPRKSQITGEILPPRGT